MSAPLSTIAGCCAPSCTDVAIAQIVGPRGDPGTNGTNGHDGSNSFTTTTALFVMPAVSANVIVPVVSSSWCVPGEVIFVQFAGYFLCAGVPDSTHVTLTNLGYAGNVAPASNIVSGAQVGPGGTKGADGAAGSATLNQLSPTKNKGDLIIDDGSLNPNAHDVRLAVGTDGQVLVANSTQPTGAEWTTVLPNTVTNANDIPRFSGTTGTPMAVKDSKLLITDSGAIQSTPTGGNARHALAVDLQVSRSVATQVASGSGAFIGGGSSNTASGTQSSVTAGLSNVASGAQSSVAGGSGNSATQSFSAVAGGINNAATGPGSFVGGGSSDTASGSASAVLAGQNNIASGPNATVGGGSGNQATGSNATVVGGAGAVADKYGQIAHASGQFGSPGDSQCSELIWRNSTTDATPTEVFLDGAALRGTIPINTSWGGTMLIVGRSSTGACAVWEVKFGIQNNANTVSLISAVSVAMISDGTGGTWGVTGNAVVSADNVNKSLKVTMIGLAATNIRFTAHARFVEIGY